MMNGTPKSIHFPLRKKGEENGEGGGGGKIYYFTSLIYSDKARCDTEAVSGDALMEGS